MTKRLETQIRKRRNSTIITSTPNTALPDTQPDFCLIFTCRADIDPPLLVDHLPHLVAACNALQKDPVKLVGLPQGAEATLAKALGLRRVTIVGIDVREIPDLLSSF